MKRLFLATLLCVCALAVCARTVTHSLVLAVHPPLSADSLTPINGGSTGRLVTIAGVWTFENFQHPSGNWSIQLNGANQNPNTTDTTSAVQLYVLNGGVLYQMTQAGVWFSWTGTGPWTGPVSDPRSSTPAMAAAAGYTTNIVKADFTGGGLYGSIGSWLRCGADSNPALGFFATFYSSTGTSACSLFSIATDPLGGQALIIHDPGNLSAPVNAPSLEFGEFTSAFGAFSVAYYVKFTGRIQSGRHNIGCCVFDFWQGVLAGFNNYGALFENDFFETGSPQVNINQNEAIWQYNGCVSGVADGQRCFGPGTQFGSGPSIDVTQYHTYERVGTTDGTSILWGCLVVDGVTNSPCVSEQPTNPTDIHALTDRNQVQIISNATSQFAQGSGSNDMYIKSFEMWACPTYASAGCTGPLITQWPQSSVPAFYVATAAGGGSDSNPGTLASPFLTLTKCQTAMRNSGTIKTCYIRAGTYTPAKVTADPFLCDHPYHSGGANAGAAVFLTSADNGETWSYYPPDGANTAIIDGQSTIGQSGDSTHSPLIPSNGPANGLGCIFSAQGTTGITITGLKMQRAVWSGFFGWTVNNMTLSNNEVTNITGVVFNSGALVWTCGTGNVVDHNYIHDVQYLGTGGWATTGSACLVNNSTISNNVIKNSCLWPPDTTTGQNSDMTGADCGAIYFEDTNAGVATASTNIVVTNNWIQDINAPSIANTNPLNSRFGIYLDQALSNATMTSNVILGKTTSCWMDHGGNNNLFQYNICDQDNSTSQWWIYESDTGNTNMANNRHINNINVLGASGSGGGYHSDATATSMTVTPNFYHNYVGTGPSTAGSDSQSADPSPVFGDPQITCWNATIAGGSPVFNAPVSFHNLTSRSWGPPGFVLPQTGTPPSWPHAC